MNKILTLLTTLLAAVSVMAGNYEINTGQVIEACAKDFPAMFYFTNARAGNDLLVNLKDLHDDDGPEMMFQMKVYGDNANGETFQVRTPGDVTFIIPSALVGENTVVVVSDLYRQKFYPDSTPLDERWEPSQFGFEALQDVPETPEVEAYSKDHHLGNPGIYVWSLFVKNIGTVDLVNPTVRYFFTVEDENVDITLFDYYTPKADLRLLQVPGTKEFALEYVFDNVTLQPGETTKGAVENQVHLYYAGYAAIDKANDFSNPIPEELFIYPNSTLFKINKKVAVYDGAGTLVEGEELPGYSTSDFLPVQ